METVTESAAGIVAETRQLVEDYAKGQIVTIDEPSTGTRALAVLANGKLDVVPKSVFDTYRDAPLFRTGTASMLSLDSLIDHANRFKDEHSAIFADDSRTAPSITVVMDYHEKTAAGEPRFGRHRGAFAFPLSDEWKAWTEKNAEPMSMVDFAAFLEDRIVDVFTMIVGEDELSEDLDKLVNTLGGYDTIASPTKLMELARGLQVNENAVVQEAVNLASGEGVVRFQSEHVDSAGAPLKVPSLFLIVIPVFRNGPLYRIAARLRYRKNGGRLVFWYELWRTDRTFDAAFRESVERARVETDLPVFIGKPEA